MLSERSFFTELEDKYGRDGQYLIASFQLVLIF